MTASRRGTKKAIISRSMICHLAGRTDSSLAGLIRFPSGPVYPLTPPILGSWRPKNGLFGVAIVIFTFLMRRPNVPAAWELQGNGRRWRELKSLVGTQVTAVS